MKPVSIIRTVKANEIDPTEAKLVPVKRYSLRKPIDFKRVRRLGKSYAHPLVILVVLVQDRPEHTRIGLSTGRSIGKAVKRNRAKRLIREALAPLLSDIQPGWDIVILARKPIINAKCQAVRLALISLLQEAGIWQPPFNTGIRADNTSPQRSEDNKMHASAKTLQVYSQPEQTVPGGEPRLRDLPITPNNLPRLFFLGLIRLYQMTVSVALPPNTCRFYPTCSHYGYQAIYKYGILKGGWMACWRVLRCNPFNPGGYDPVP